MLSSGGGVGERGLGEGLGWVQGDYMREPSRGFTELKAAEGWVDPLSQLMSTSSARVGR